MCWRPAAWRTNHARSREIKWITGPWKRRQPGRESESTCKGSRVESNGSSDTIGRSKGLSCLSTARQLSGCRNFWKLPLPGTNRATCVLDFSFLHGFWPRSIHSQPFSNLRPAVPPFGVLASFFWGIFSFKAVNEKEPPCSCRSFHVQAEQVIIRIWIYETAKGINRYFKSSST